MSIALKRQPRTPSLVNGHPDDLALIADALGLLWQTAPKRREEIKEMCLRTGLRVTVDL